MYTQVAVHIKRNMSAIRFHLGFQAEWQERKRSHIIFDAYARANLVKSIFLCAINANEYNVILIGKTEK